MLQIKRGGIVRICDENAFKNKFKGQGYEIIGANSTKKPNKKVKPKINIKDYYAGGGWYHYKGESYRKDDLLKVLKGSE